MARLRLEPLLLLYRLLVSLLTPLLLLVLLARAWRGKEDPRRLPERLGWASRRRPAGPLVWLHAASVGELSSLVPLLLRLQQAAAPPTLLVTSVTRTAAELAPRLRVNCIAPSLTRTPLAAKLTGNEAMAKAIAALHPLPRLGEPDDAAALGAFLLGPESGWITGQVIGVDGGRSSLRVKG